jgi:hypothetical protein
MDSNPHKQNEICELDSHLSLKEKLIEGIKLASNYRYNRHIVILIYKI